MPELCRFYGISIRLHFCDHNPPHFHALYGEHEAVIELNGISVVDGRLPALAVDFNGDGTANFTDYTQFAAHLGRSDCDPRHDLDGNVTVDFADSCGRLRSLILEEAFGKYDGAMDGRGYNQRPQQCLNLLPLWQKHGSFGLGRFSGGMKQIMRREGGMRNVNVVLLLPLDTAKSPKPMISIPIRTSASSRPAASVTDSQETRTLSGSKISTA
ncbi:MAG: DUF4160 domain-containing protein [Gemmatimonadota bacterium]|nr:DUF4160 domain-containing protein [Gemmatimonadota bacterium]